MLSPRARAVGVPEEIDAALDGVDASSLLDQRDQLALRLAQLVGGTATQRSDGGLDVTVGGVALVPRPWPSHRPVRGSEEGSIIGI